MLLIKNGVVLDPFTQTEQQMDVLIDNDGRIAQVQADIRQTEQMQFLDATGLTVSPGFVDGHVHFRDPGQTEKEDILSGAAAAAQGGYATVICMANTAPTCDSVEWVQYVQEKAKNLPVQVLQAASITKGLRGEEMTDFAALKAAGAPCLTDDGINLSTPRLCYDAMKLASDLDIILSFHEEDPSLVPSQGVNFGSAAAQKFGVPGAMKSAESIMVARDIAMSIDTGARVVFQHISAGTSVDLIRVGKALGANIHAELTPHHLSLTEDAVLQHGTMARMNPPLRTEQDRQKLIAGLMDGTLDMVATDHAPHTAEEKAREFAMAPSGITGLETAFSVCNTYLVKPGYLSPMTLLKRMCQAPAQLYGLSERAVEKGNFARLVLLDWKSSVTYTSYASKASNTPYTGMELFGQPKGIVCGSAFIARK